jgi:hypothetical protein
MLSNSFKLEFYFKVRGQILASAALPSFQTAIGRPTHLSVYWSTSITVLEVVRNLSTIGKETLVSSFDQAANQFIYRWKKLITAINNLYSALEKVELLQAQVEMFCLYNFALIF